MDSYILDWKKYSALARQTAAEGCVLLRNERHTLPLVPGDTVAVFGRIQMDYYRSGTGSGGMVNAPYVRSILDGLQEYVSRDIRIYDPLLSHYQNWAKSHPFDKGSGWGTEPWCQEEMELSEELVCDAARHANIALVILGRTAGEDQDNSAQPGSYYLTATEKDMLKKVCTAFSRTAVILNVGNIIDMSWVEAYAPGAVLYVWQGGMEGGCGAADVLCGAVSPCGKLADTIARDLSDYPSAKNFGSSTANLYQEDIYVGYRYFETFAPEKVLWPFGFGLSYTDFDLCAGLSVSDASSGIADHRSTAASDDFPIARTVTAAVTNTGSCPGKEVVQVYCCPPQGRLGKPLRNLCSFAKTHELKPGETQYLELPIPVSVLASYDDSGATGYKSCFVLEAGEYRFYVGTDVRSARYAGSFRQPDTCIISRLSEAMAPVVSFERFRPGAPHALPGEEPFAFTGEPAPLEAPLSLTYEEVPQRTVSPDKRRLEHLPDCLAFTGDVGYRLADVAAGSVSMEQFLAQLSDTELSDLVKGEGMCSPKVTPGTAAAFGGITEALQKFGIPAGCCADGPSGIRMDCGTGAFSLPNGTLLACTFNAPLITALFEMEGLELYANQIDSLLGPGINIHRSPLNGRNFEYASEDPYLTGRMAQAQVEGMLRWNVSGTMKHFCCNNQEYCRSVTDSIVSERALREIYLRPFEMGVQSGARSVMTTYGPVNGIWTAGNYDLNTTVLRKQWHYDGLVMTDWWAKMNDDGQAASVSNLSAMVRAQNDVYMVTQDAQTYEDNLKDAISNGTLSRAELVRNAANICRFLLKSPAMERLLGTYHEVTYANIPDAMTLSSGQDLEFYPVSAETVLPIEHWPVQAGGSLCLGLTLERDGIYCFSLSASSHGSELAQMSVSLSVDGTVLDTFTWRGSSEASARSTEKELRGLTHYLKLFCPQGGLTLHTLTIRRLTAE